MRQPRPYDRFCRATSAFRPPEGVLAARVAQLAAGATHVFARVRQKDLSQALRFVKKPCQLLIGRGSSLVDSMIGGKGNLNHGSP